MSKILFDNYKFFYDLHAHPVKKHILNKENILNLEAKLKNNYTEHKILILVLSIWLTATIIGYISDNGRYTYLPALLILGNWLRSLNRPLRDTR